MQDCLPSYAYMVEAYASIKYVVSVQYSESNMIWSIGESHASVLFLFDLLHLF